MEKITYGWWKTGSQISFHCIYDEPWQTTALLSEAIYVKVGDGLMIPISNEGSLNGF